MPYGSSLAARWYTVDNSPTTYDLIYATLVLFALALALFALSVIVFKA